MLKRTPLGHWVVVGDGGVSRLVEQASSFEYPENLDVLTRVAPMIPEGGVVVDAGASIGDQTVMYSQIVGPEGMVYAFEPQSESYAALVRNVARLTNVATVNAALGSAAQERVVFSVSPTNLGASFVGTMAEYADFPTERVRVKTLDGWFYSINRLDFIHLDAEGMEPQILEGAAGLIARFHPILLIEVTPQWLARYGSSQEQLYQQLARLGYPTMIPMQNNPHWFDVLAVPAGRSLEMAHAD